jgi:regulatory protein
MPFQRAKKQPDPLDEHALYDYAVKALGRRMRTVSELTRLMRQKVEKEPTGQARIDAVIVRLKEYGYLDDASYAATYTRLRQENASMGKRRVQQDLAGKGVEKALIATTLETAYENVNEEELARRHLERKRVQQPANEKEAARVMRLLMRAGFSTAVIYQVLKRWNVEEEALTALENLEDPHNGVE